MKKRRQGGFTLIELTLVMGISVLVASGLIGMFNAHIQMVNQASKFKFLAQDAPVIGLLLTRTIGNAEDYRIYASGSAARSNGTPLLTGPAVRLWMRQPNSTFRQAVVSFETINGQQGIYFFLANSAGTFSATPNWKLAGSSPVSLSNATFAFDSTAISPTDPHPGVLLVTLNGSYNDWYKFAAEKK
jgi:prepilin-type N-terminal cleavage/methylation domain-containing protein